MTKYRIGKGFLLLFCGVCLGSVATAGLCAGYYFLSVKSEFAKLKMERDEARNELDAARERTQREADDALKESENLLKEAEPKQKEAERLLEQFQDLIHINNKEAPKEDGQKKGPFEP